MAEYEKSDVSATGVSLFGAGLAAFVVISGLALWLIMRVLDHTTANGQMPDVRSEQATRGGGAPAFVAEGNGPHLQSDEVDDLARQRAQVNARLNSYGWVDRPSGVIHIPIERAMDLMVQQAQVNPATPDAK